MEDKSKDAKEKPLDKMTIKEVREIALEIPDITGAHGMNKAELIQVVKVARGIGDKTKKKSDSSVRDIKKKSYALKRKKEAAISEKDKKMATIYRRRISRLKKKSRKAA